MARPGQVVLDQQQLRPGAADDAQQQVHAGDLLQLLVHEPLQEVVGDVVALLGSLLHQGVDLLGHLHLPVQGELDRLLRGGEAILRRPHGRDDDAAAGLDEVVDELHGVLPLLLGLTEEVAGQVGQVLRPEVRADRHVLLRGAELASDLGVDGVGELLGDQHGTASFASSKWEACLPLYGGAAVDGAPLPRG